MNILFVTTEAVPFAKTGGLADVAGALPQELNRMGENVTVVMPAFRQVFQAGVPIETTDITFQVPIAGKTVEGRLLRSKLPGSDVPVYLIQQGQYFDREQLYGEGGEDYADNCERFVFFCRAVLAMISRLGLGPDIVHCNDWQTALIPAYLKSEYADKPGFRQIKTLYTIHNLAYQGSFWHWDMGLTGLDWSLFNWQQMEFYGKLNLMKTGLVFADWINTVSPRYAQEIQAEELGCGLDGVLRSRADRLSGIINGVDYGDWNPATDPRLAENYDVDSFREKKAVCKAALQQEMGLPQEADALLIGLVGRFVQQKGFDLIGKVIPEWLGTTRAQWALLGTGQPEYENQLRHLANNFPDRVSVCNTFSNDLAHRIEAGADVFLMPSRYEPCGLNQLYSLRYGTVPIVRATGGLADTITDATNEALAGGTANGFSFEPYEAQSLSAALWRAQNLYRDKAAWHRLIETGMRQDWSWSRSAEEYRQLYRQATAQSHHDANA